MIREGYIFRLLLLRALGILAGALDNLASIDTHGTFEESKPTS